MSTAGILVLNGGSSTIKFALYEHGPVLGLRVRGCLDQSASPQLRLTATNLSGQREEDTLTAVNGESPAIPLLSWLQRHTDLNTIRAVGHRIVHGMERRTPELVTPALLLHLRSIIPYDPDHLPGAIALIEALQRHFPKLPQVACYDTEFHSTMPRVATQMAVPRRLEAKGVRRYGFHGQSYAFLTAELARLGDDAITNGRVILAHLGSGASICAVLNGASIDTSMGFTPSSGLVMRTRSGDVDPSLAGFLGRTEQMSESKFDDMIQHKSGLLGVSETSGDMRELLAREATDVRAAEAVSLFCYQARKWIGAYVAALGGLDTIVFAGGIGEHAATVRARICDGLEFLGVQLQPDRNTANAAIISADDSRVTVRVIQTDEEIMIARAVVRLLAERDPAERDPA